MVTEATRRTACIAFTVICWTCVLPFICICTWKFYQSRHDIMIKKRNITLMLLISLSVASISCIERPIYLLSWVLYPDSKLFYYLWAFAWILFGWPTCWLLLLKYWLIFFNVHWTKVTLNQTWQIHLNKSAVEDNWYLRKKATFGNVSWCIKRLSVMFFFLCVPMLSAVAFIFGRIGNVMAFALTCAALMLFFPLAIFYLFWRIRAFKDEFFVIHEARMVVVVFLMTIFLFVIAAMLPTFGLLLFYRFLVTASIFVILPTISLYSQTWYVVHITSSLYQETDSNQSRSNEHMKSNSKLTLQQILKDEALFEEFMQHLGREWSMELLLAFIEITQLQQLIKDVYFADEESVSLDAKQLELLENTGIPRSYIVHHANMQELLHENTVNMEIESAADGKMLELKIKSYLLYRKYAESSSELQINISYEQQQKLSALMHNIYAFVHSVNISELELFNVYHDVVQELEKLLTHSYHRFVASPLNN